MNVLHVVSGLDPAAGGPAMALVGLTRAQARIGLNVSLLATWREGASPAMGQQLEADGVHVRQIGPTTAGGLQRAPGIAEAAREMVGKADVVHIHALWEEVQHQAARAAQAKGVPYIFRPCGMLDPHTLGQKAWKKRLYLAWRLRRNLDRAAAIHFTSEGEREGTSVIGLKAPSIVEPNGVDLSEFESLPARGTFRKKWGIADDRLVVLFLARVHPIKGLDLLIPAFAKAQHAKSGAALVIAGGGDAPYVESIRALAKTHGIDQHVIFPGMLNGRERVEAYADADLYALPSRHENFGIAVVEALAAGCPVVISDQVGIHPELSRAGVAGVARLDVDALTRQLSEWMNDEPRRREGGARGRRFVCENYDWNRIAERWRGRYEDLCAMRKK